MTDIVKALERIHHIGANCNATGHNRLQVANIARELLEHIAANDLVLVPRTPTQAMCMAGQEKAREWPTFPLRISPIYQAMLEAAKQ